MIDEILFSSVTNQTSNAVRGYNHIRFPFLVEHSAMGIDGAEITRRRYFFYLAPTEHKITECRNRCAAKMRPTFSTVFPPKEIWKVTIPGRREEHRLFFFLPRGREIKGRMPRRRQAADNVRERRTKRRIPA